MYKYVNTPPLTTTTKVAFPTSHSLTHNQSFFSIPSSAHRNSKITHFFSTKQPFFFLARFSPLLSTLPLHSDDVKQPLWTAKPSLCQYESICPSEKRTQHFFHSFTQTILYTAQNPMQSHSLRQNSHQTWVLLNVTVKAQLIYQFHVTHSDVRFYFIHQQL